MASEKKTTKITVNTTEARSDLEALRKHLKETREEYKRVNTQAVLLSDSLSDMEQAMKKLEQEGKKETKEFAELEKKFEAGSEQAKVFKQRMGELLGSVRDDANAIKHLDNQLATFDAVIKDLSKSSLRQLTGATREANRQLRNMSSSSDKLSSMHERMDKIARESKIVKGEFVNVAKGIGELSAQSDKWLSKAIKTQQDIVAATKKTDDAYKTELATLRKLEAEEDKRKGKMTIDDANKTIANKDATTSDLRRARAAYVEGRDKVATSDTALLAEYDKALAYVDKRLEAVNGKVKKAQLSWQELNEVINDPKHHSVEKVEQALEQMQAQLKKMPAGAAATDEFRRKMEQLQKAVKGTALSQQELSNIIMRSKTGKVSLDELRRAYKQLEEEIEHLDDVHGPAFKTYQKEMVELKKKIESATGAVNKQSSAWKTAFHNLTAYVGLFAAFNKLKEMMTDIIRLNLKYSDQLANIRKVSGLSMKSVEELSDKLAKIDSRTSLEGLTELAYQGSRLGMGEYGVSGLYEFVKAADKVNVALKEDLGDEALSQLSKLVETMGLIKKYGVEDAMDKVGSSIFRLASTSTARGDSIVEFSKRITGLSRVSHIATEELMALASTSDSLMLMPEVASTAFSKFITALQTNFTAIEKDLSLAPDTLKNLLEQKKTMEAIQLVLDRLGKKGGMNALNNMFKDLGSDGDRLKNVIVTMSQNTEILNKHLRVSREAFEEGTAVEFEYNIQQETANALIERANNLWEKTIMTSGNANGAIKQLAMAWYEISEYMTTSQLAGMAVNAVVVTLTTSVKLLVNLLPTLITMLGTYGLTQTLGALANAAWGAEGAVTKLTQAWKTMNTVTKTSWIGAIIAGATALTFTLIELNKKVDASAEAMRKMKGMVGDARGELYAAQTELTNYKTAIEKATVGTNEHATAIEQFNKKFGVYLDTLLTEKSTAEDLAKAYQTVNKQLERKLALELKNEMHEELVKPELKKLGQTTVEYDDLAASSGLGSEMLLSIIADNKAKGKKGMTKDQLIADIAQRLGVDNNYVGNRNIIDVVKNYTGEGAPANEIVENQNGKTKMWDVAAGTNVNMKKHTRTYSNEERALFLAAQIINQRTKIDQTEASIDKQLKGFTNVDLGIEDKNLCPNCGAEMPKGSAVCPKCGFGKLTNTNNNSNSNSTQEKEWRQQLKEAQSDANAIIDKIKNYYERQILEVTEKANSLNLDEAQTEALTRPIRAKMNDALAVARKAISNVEQGWDTFKQTMQDDMIEVMGENGLNESQMLLDQIEKADLKALQEKIRTLSKSLNRPESALMDQIWRNATKNAQANADAERKQREEIQKILLEHNYTGIVDNNTTQQMEKIGAFGLSAKQVQTLLGGKEGEAEALLAEREKQIKQLLEKARTNIVDILSTDLDKEGGRDKFLTAILGNKEDWEKNSSELSAILNMDKENLKAFFYELIKYNDEYDAAMKKKADERKKLNDYGFSKTATSKFDQAAIDLSTEQKKESSRQYSFGAKNDAISPWGQTEATDPELALLQLKMKLAKDYYAYIKAHGATDEQLIEAGKNVQEAYSSIMDAVVAKAQATAEAQRKWYKPIEQYGTALGEAVFDESKTVKKATQDMINSFIDLTGEYVNQKITQWVMTKLYNQFMAQSEEELAVTKQTVAAENATTAVTEAGVEVAAGEAAAGAKTLGQLGWWGIPLLAVIGAVLGGLLSMAKGALNSAFGGGDTGNTAKGPNTKLVSGMLTYDQGNVQDLKPFFDKDGNMYWATEDDDRNHDGINLLTHPTATTINGAPSLVAEQGPELVIGRETTAAMMQNNPALLKALYQYDKHHSGRTAYDQGNLSEQLASTATVPAGSPAGIDTALADATASNVALLTAVNALLQRLNEPIKASINMYGRDGLYESNKKAQAFMKNK